MLQFILKGILRDKQRSVLPIVVVGLGVMLTTFFYGYLKGVISGMLSSNAKLGSGHLKVMTREYAELEAQSPNDLAILDVPGVLQKLRTFAPDITWVPRTRFGGLLDIPDKNGDTRAQGPVIGIGLDLLSPGSTEVPRMDLKKVTVEGRIPQKPGELLISRDLAKNLHASLGETVTLISSTAGGSMAIHNFVVVGFTHFGMGPLDRNLILADLSDVQYALNMENASGEILGFMDSGYFDRDAAEAEITRFKQTELSSLLVMHSLADSQGIGDYLDMVDVYVWMDLGGMILLMTVVLWNSALMAGLRRYGEIGIRLAMGESKGELLRWLLYEAAVIGLIGATLGACAGMGINYYLQEVGIDISEMMKGSTVIMPPVLRARVLPEGFFVGFLPGLCAIVLGTALAGIGIYKRNTASLFKELEV
ncbi:MAG: ABC transporter permease [Bdellovibrionales bacterium]|nr:ABC transporter permease [Bdellovibrionales bacterium]